MQTRLLTLSLAGSLLAFASCQRTPYAAFQHSSTQPIERVQTAPHSTPVAAVETVSPVVMPVETQAAAVSAPVEASDRTVTWSTQTSIAPVKLAKPVAAAKQPSKLVAKRIEKIKSHQSARAQGKDSGGDTMALLSLIFGGAGLLFLLVGGYGTILFGLAGLILGLVALKRTSKRTMAVLGIVFGGIVVLVGLLAVIAVSTI